MKVLVDLDRARAEGIITADVSDRLRALSAWQTSDLVLNILIGFGVIAVAAGSLAVFPSAVSAIVVGLMVGVPGLALVGFGAQRWSVLGNILVVVGAMLLAGGLVVLGDGKIRVFLAAAAIFAGGAVIARNGLLAVASVLMLASALGAGTGYRHAMYFLAIKEPVHTIIVFSVLAVGLTAAAPRLEESLARLAVVAARTSVLLVNFGFWVGSLWGERIESIRFPRDLFTVVWAVALIAAAVWAWRNNRRWVLITATVFAAIHFYTQWFERLGAQPLAVLSAGVIVIVIGAALKTVLAAMPDRPGSGA